MLARRESGVELGRCLKKRHERLRDAAVFLAGLLDDASLHKVLELLVSAQSQHFFPATGEIPGTEVGMDDVEKRFELQRALLGKHRCKLLSDSIWTPK